MSLLQNLQKLVSKENIKKEQEDSKNTMLQKRKQEIAAKKIKEDKDNAIYKKFRNVYKYGKIDSTSSDANFKNAGNLTFGDCLKKAYCQNISDKDRENGICSNDEKFYPYMGWKQLETQDKGLCWLGNEQNDIINFDKGDMSIYVTPIEGDGNLDGRENQGKINLIKRLQKDLDQTTRNLLHEKNKYNDNKNENIKDNYMKLSNLDKTIMTISQKIRDNNSRYIVNEKAADILDISVKVTIVLLAIFLIYFSISYAKMFYNNST